MKIVLVGQRHIASAQLERHGTASLVAHPFGMVKMDSRVKDTPRYDALPSSIIQRSSRMRSRMMQTMKLSSVDETIVIQIIIIIIIIIIIYHERRGIKLGLYYNIDFFLYDCQSKCYSV